MLRPGGSEQSNALPSGGSYSCTWVSSKFWRSPGLPCVHGNSQPVPTTINPVPPRSRLFIAICFFRCFCFKRFVGVLFWAALGPLLGGITLLLAAVFGFVSICYWEDAKPAMASSVPVPVVHVSLGVCALQIYIIRNSPPGTDFWHARRRLYH